MLVSFGARLKMGASDDLRKIIQCVVLACFWICAQPTVTSDEGIRAPSNESDDGSVGKWKNKYFESNTHPSTGTNSSTKFNHARFTSTETWQQFQAGSNTTFLKQNFRGTNPQTTKTREAKLTTGGFGTSPTDIPQTRPDKQSLRTEITDSSHVDFTAQHTGNFPTATRSQSTVTSFRLNVADCSNDKFVPFSGTQGEVLGLYGNANSTWTYCGWQISVPKAMYMIVKVEITKNENSCRSIQGSFRLPFYSWQQEKLGCFRFQPAIFIPDSNVMYFKLETQSALHVDTLPKFKVSFTATTQNWRNLLHVQASSAGGYVTNPGYDGTVGYAPFMNASCTVDVPQNHTLMVSFERFDLQSPLHIAYNTPSCEDSVMLLTGNERGTEKSIFLGCGTQYFPPDVYNRSLTVRFLSNVRYFATGFKMRFSLHRWPDVPRKMERGLFDCSGSNYDSFKEHVHCNMEQECRGREDEGGHCPFSSPACNGSVALGNKCYTFLKETNIPWDSAFLRCQSRGSSLAMMKTKEEMQAFSVLFDYVNRIRKRGLVGLTSFQGRVPPYYRKSTKWVDNTVNYLLDVDEYGVNLVHPRTMWKVCGYYSDGHLRLHYCNQSPFFFYVCESSQKEAASAGKVFISRELSSEDGKHRPATPFVRCPSGHVTYECFACLRQSRCGSDVSRSKCSFPSSAIRQEQQESSQPRQTGLVENFQCTTTKEFIQYTFVCDFKRDCADGSDEDFCVHGQHCMGFTCDSGQCIRLQDECDFYPDCEDESDEIRCEGYSHNFVFRQNKIPPPAVVYFDGSGRLTQIAMNESQPCPETHFRCPGKLDYCMPVYVRCNGVYDCVGREDEAGCDSGVTCPGFYRCWDSAVCVHPDHICDGWPQCPRHDDELLCNFTCPRGCHCYGRAFLCRQPFPARDFPDLRYLDASGSGMKVEDLTENRYLIVAFLTFCRLTSVSAVQLPNLKILDLAENLLRIISMDSFLLMRNLKFLRLAGNPLVTLISGNSSAPAVDVESIDMSRTHLETFDSAPLGKFSTIKKLNISFGRLRKISNKGFRSFLQLTSLDIRGSPVDTFRSDVFKGLTELQVIFTSNFRLCCKTNLPETFEEAFCFSPQDEISSCEDLLRSNIYRLFLWMISVMSFIGNVGSFIFRCASQKNVSKSGFNVFVTNLCLADLLMGVYLAMVGIADLRYRGQYLWYEKIWTSSEACRVAGVLSLLSSEVSAFIICLITLDRFIVLQFPFSSLRFRRKSAVIACCLVWITGLYSASSSFVFQ